MRITHHALPALTALALFVAASARAVDTTYVWESSDGNPDDYSGTIVLNSSSNPSGTTSDIVSITLSDPSGTYNADLATDIGYFSPPFSWTSSTITALDLYLLNSTSTESWTLTAGSLTDDNLEFADSGSWDAVSSSVPDSLSTLPVLFSLAVALILYRQAPQKSSFQR